MKILVCISKAPDTTSKIAFKDNETRFNEDGVQFIVNPYDEWYALVRALELKETLGGNVTILNVGKAENEAIIRKALAIGADDAVRIDAEPSDAFYVAEQIAAYAKDKSFDLIMVGKETINYNGSEVGAMIAELLSLPFVSLATKLNYEGNEFVIEHDIDGGTEIVSCAGPLVLSASKGMAEARIPNMRGIMAARTKPLNVVTPAAGEMLTEVKKYAAAQGRTACKFIDAENAGSLIELLHTEAKVI
jgi:electron transfer flavoprotein beta subunit